MHNVLTFLSDNQWLLISVSVASITLLAMTVLATPWVLARLPEDYFCQDPQKTYGTGIRRWLWHALLNILGTVVVLLGIIMMFTPGPGLVVMLAGLSMLRLPAKHRWIRAIAARPGIFDTMNRLRERSQRPPFIHPEMRKNRTGSSGS